MKRGGIQESGCVAWKGACQGAGYMYPSQWPGRVLHATLASSLGLRWGEASMP